MLNKQPKHTINTNDEARTKSGLHSLLMMCLGAIIAVLFGLFLYFSPFFRPKATPIETASQVEPLPTPNEKGEYEFYDILPEQEFHSVPEGVSVQSRIIEQSNNLKVDTVATQDNTHNGESSEDAAMPQNHQKPNQADITRPITQELPVNNSTPPEMNATTNNERDRIHITQGTPSVTYILQIRSFDNADQADQRRAEVIMAGVDAEVVRRESDGQTLYQVISAPFVNQDAATVAYKRLQNAGIDSVIVQQKHR